MKDHTFKQVLLFVKCYLSQHVSKTSVLEEFQSTERSEADRSRRERRDRNSLNYQPVSHRLAGLSQPSPWLRLTHKARKERVDFYFQFELSRAEPDPAGHLILRGWNTFEIIRAVTE